MAARPTVEAQPALPAASVLAAVLPGITGGEASISAVPIPACPASPTGAARPSAAIVAAIAVAALWPACQAAPVIAPRKRHWTLGKDVPSVALFAAGSWSAFVDADCVPRVADARLAGLGGGFAPLRDRTLRVLETPDALLTCRIADTGLAVAGVARAPGRDASVDPAVVRRGTLGVAQTVDASPTHGVADGAIGARMPCLAVSRWHADAVFAPSRGPALVVGQTAKACVLCETAMPAGEAVCLRVTRPRREHVPAVGKDIPAVGIRGRRVRNRDVRTGRLSLTWPRTRAS